MSNWIYHFSKKNSDGDETMRNLLGGKGANLAQMCKIGLPVPPGFTLTTELCNYFYENQQSYPADLEAAFDKAITHLEAELGLKFGDNQNPLLVSVRSGARVSMPGMMDTVLNLGLNDATVQGLAAQSGDDRFAHDSYRRFIQMYGNVVLGVAHHLFEDILEQHKNDVGAYEDTELSTDSLKSVIADYKSLVRNQTNQNFPTDPKEQLWQAIGAVFQSWMSPRAITYRKLNSISSQWGTAVNVQAMVFGNMGDDCATGVAFTRNPSTGENMFYGEYLINAQGEDVVAGIRTPQPLTIQAKQEQGTELPAMEETMPQAFKELSDIRALLEKHYGDMQDIEFTIQRDKLYMLQTRAGKRSARAALKIAVDLVNEGIADKKNALMNIAPHTLDQLLHPTLDQNSSKSVLAVGLPASPGAACGQAIFTAEHAEAMAQNGMDVILVRSETSPEDIHGMHAARGILTARGGMTSHAAVVARGMGRPCVAGASSLVIDEDSKSCHIGSTVIKEGDYITIDGSTGEVIQGKVNMVLPELSDEFSTIMEWADEFRTLKIRTNAETPTDSKVAREFGAEGIGLCRTEHMFFEGERITAMRQMILASSEQSRRHALAKIQPMQSADFLEIFKMMKGLPVTIRLLDPPLHEFLPHSKEELEAVAEAAGIDVNIVTERTKFLEESNPMLGHRGCRLLVTYPEICEMQARAIFIAAANASKETGEAVLCEIMIPLAATKQELSLLKDVIIRVAKEVCEETGQEIPYMVGTMIELPRAALMAHELAEQAEFFSFGTNDLTQTVWGLSRDDAGKFLAEYENKGIIDNDPFTTIDVDGVGKMVEMGVAGGRITRPDIKLGVCGEHGGDPASVHFFHKVGLDYVSCSPYRVPIARLAAAQAGISEAGISEAGINAAGMSKKS
ncbi:MAG: pyruvate, phosphate dikinase [Alphaproteobacteria bacterium]|nr:pyruvate, phosphate dikinase [Alphaproteobacteria bacterium]